MKLKQFFLFNLLLFIGCSLLQAQNNVGIGVPSPDPSAILDLNGTTSKGLLIPTMDSTQRKAIQSPANGLMVYDNSVNCFYYYVTSGGWTSMCPQGGPNPFNTSLNYNAQTDTLSITDGGGTKSVSLKPMRAFQQADTDLSVIGSPAILDANLMRVANYTPIPTMKVSFTPNQSVVFITASISGEGQLNTSQAQQMYICIKDSANPSPNPIVAGGSICSVSYPISGTDEVTAWDIALAAPYYVTPGVPVTLQMYWWYELADGTAAKAQCLARSYPKSNHCNILVFE